MNNLPPRVPLPTAGLRISLILVFAAVCLHLVIHLCGCSNSTEPEIEPEQEVTIRFFPSGQGQSLSISQTMEFYAATNPATSLTANWYRGGDLVGQDTVLTYVPAEVGRDTLQVSAFSGAVRDTYYWAIDVEEDVSVVPPEVPYFDAQAGDEPADVVVTWIRVSGATFPLVEYLVAVSYDGPINGDNWDLATIIGTFASIPGQIQYSEVFTQLEHDMRPGERAWFGVRVRDDRQLLSPLTSSSQHDITWAWYLGGLVTDDAGLPLSVVGVTTGDNSGNTDGRGVFLFNDPFRSIDGVRVTTTSSSWYNFQTPPVFAEQETTRINITLINHYDLGDPSCWAGHFLEFLRVMTRTQPVIGQPSASMLFTWDEYPVSVFIPPGELNEAGVDMELASLAALDFWNTTMRNDADLLGIEETDYLVRTQNEAAADIVFLFALRPLNYGTTSLELPADHALGEAIPELVQIWINTTPALDSFADVQGIALHEFGHALGLFNHSNCPSIDYLMGIVGGIGAMDRPEPIHIDERRAVRAIRTIPQGANMADFAMVKSGNFE